jgi:TolB protein
MDVGAQIWLPDGQGLLITGREHPGDPFQIYQISYPVGEVHRITNDTNSYSALSITTDSKRLIAEVDDLNSNIWVMTNGNPASARQITYTGKDGVGGISWTPDGRVVYATISRDSYNQTGASGDKAIWVIDADGQNRKQLTFDDGINSDPAVSPDGRYIVFSAYRDGAWGIWRMNIDGSDAIQLATGGALTNPACTPDGQWVLFKRLSTSSELNICRVSIHGGEIVEVTDKNAFAPSVSPDGKLVAFFSTEETRNLLRVVPLAGGEPVKTLNVSPDNDYLLFANITHWSHDGRLLTYSDSKRHVSNIYGVPFNGGPITQLTHFNSDIIFNFAWSFDGSKLAVAKGQFTRMVVSITDFSPETIPNP